MPASLRVYNPLFLITHPHNDPSSVFLLETVVHLGQFQSYWAREANLPIHGPWHIHPVFLVHDICHGDCEVKLSIRRVDLLYNY